MALLAAELDRHAGIDQMTVHCQLHIANAGPSFRDGPAFVICWFPAGKNLESVTSKAGVRREEAVVG